MPRRGRSASPPPSRNVPMRSAPAQPMRVAPAQPPAPTSAPTVAPEQPSLLKQMAATAGGVAVGSTVGHVVGHGITSMFSGGGSGGEVSSQQQAAVSQQPYSAAQTQEPTGPCAWEIKQFLKCAQDQSDLSLCAGFNEAIRQCKETNRVA